MKRVIYRAFWDYEKEEKWLNTMAEKGWGLACYTWCRYVFEESTKGEYIYRIELLKKRPSHPESQDYLHFLEETGITCITTYISWVYLRKKASEGGFNLYSDAESRMEHYKRVNRIWIIFGFIEGLIGLANILLGIMNGQADDQSRLFNVGSGLAALVIAAFFAKISLSLFRKINRLKSERMIRE